jgi:hypothetical protein
MAMRAPATLTKIQTRRTIATMGPCRRMWLTMLLAYLSACAGSGPYRDATEALMSPPTPAPQSAVDGCSAIYIPTDRDIREVASNFSLSDTQRNEKLIAIQQEVKQSYLRKEERHCWDIAHEHHPDYELFYAEFDDAGQAVDRVKGAKYEESELYLIESYLKGQLNSISGQGFNIVLFTHGWHGSARASDTYSLEFKGMLQDIAQRESNYAASSGAQRPSGFTSVARTHRVIGIEVAWRGDSILFPKVASVWDRKLAAESVSIGAVHELFGFLNQIYLDNSCHSGRENDTKNTGPCDRVHLLTIGHSYGALINFRSLVSRLQSGLNVDPCFRAYGFGDMTILLNPALEGARYRALFNQGLSRHVVLSEYFGDPDLDQTKCRRPTIGNTSGTIPSVQIPTVVTLQSEGDQATGLFFPIFRRLATPFAKTLTPEESHDKNTALGWNDDFRTHNLTIPMPPISADTCTPSKSPVNKSPMPSQTVASADTAVAFSKSTRTFCPFIFGNPVQGDTTSTQISTHFDHMQLEYAPGTTHQLPSYLPLWSIGVSKDIMRNHDDFWNPQIIRLISILFEDAYEQTEHIHGTGLQ